ncbi:MAG: tetratricopeptide repeat protein, partial [Candidatus Omnitrophota bacterium]
MKKILIIASCLLFHSLHVCAEEKPFQNDIDFARKAIKDGFYDLAEGKLNYLLVTDIPREVEIEVHILLGRIFYEKLMPIQALTEFNLILDRYRDSDYASAAAYWIAEVYFREENFEQALSYYNMIITSYPSSEFIAYAYYSQAWCYYEMGEYPAALDAFREVSRIFPDDELAVKAKYKVSEIMYKTALYPEAIRELGSFIKNYPVNEQIFDAYYMIGDSFYKLEDFNAAVENLTRSLQCGKDEPWRPVAAYKLARSCFQTGRIELSEQYFEQVLAETDAPDITSAAIMGIALIHSKKNDFEKTSAAYRKIINDIPRNEWTDDAYYWLGQCLYKYNDFEEAAEVYNKALYEFPNGPFSDKMHYNLAWAYIGIGREDDALREFDLTVELSDDENLVVSSLFAIGDILQNKEKNSEAVDVYDRVLREFPKSILADREHYDVVKLHKNMATKNAAILAFQSLIV